MTKAMPIFQSLREDLPQSALSELKAAVRAHLEQLLAEQKKNEFVATDLAEMLCSRLEELLAVAHVMTTDARKDVVGAARYFVSSADLVPDERPCTGLDDDVEIFNHVARLLARPDLVISE